MQLVVNTYRLKVVFSNVSYCLLNPTDYFLNFWIGFFPAMRVIRGAPLYNILSAFAPPILIDILVVNMYPGFALLNLHLQLFEFFNPICNLVDFN